MKDQILITVSHLVDGKVVGTKFAYSDQNNDIGYFIIGINSKKAL